MTGIIVQIKNLSRSLSAWDSIRWTTAPIDRSIPTRNISRSLSAWDVAGVTGSGGVKDCRLQFGQYSAGLYTHYLAGVYGETWQTRVEFVELATEGFG